MRRCVIQRSGICTNDLGERSVIGFNRSRHVFLSDEVGTEEHGSIMWTCNPESGAPPSPFVSFNRLRPSHYLFSHSPTVSVNPLKHGNYGIGQASHKGLTFAPPPSWNRKMTLTTCQSG
jgi:hypothetical protein